MSDRQWYRIWGQLKGKPFQQDVLVRKDGAGQKRCWRAHHPLIWAKGQTLAVLRSWVDASGMKMKRLPKGFDRTASGANVVPIRPGRKPKSS